MRMENVHKILLDFLKAALRLSCDVGLTLNFTLKQVEYKSRISGCIYLNIYVNQPEKQCYIIGFIHYIWWLHMFRTSMFHPQDRLQAVCCKFGMW